MKTKTLNYYQDPSHGWARVDVEYFTKIMSVMNQGRISGCSYISHNAIFLEEDQDLGIFIEVAKCKGVEIKLKSKHSNKSSRIRNYNSYDPRVVQHLGITKHKAKKRLAIDCILKDDKKLHTYNFEETSHTINSVATSKKYKVYLKSLDFNHYNRKECHIGLIIKDCFISIGLCSFDPISISNRVIEVQRHIDVNNICVGTLGDNTIKEYFNKLKKGLL